MLLTRFRCGVPLPFLICMIVVPVFGQAADETKAALLPEILAPLTTTVDYRLKISGEIVTPSESGPQRFPLKSSGEFQFQNSTFPSKEGGPFALRAVRRFQAAATSTTVANDHNTDVALSPAYRTVTVSGSEKGLIVWSPNFALPRKQLDLLQMPFDVLAVRSLLPTNAVKVGDRWNTDAWLVPMLTGIEAVIEQSATCELISLDDDFAVVSLSGKISGAVQGSTSEVSFSGQVKINRAEAIVESLTATQKEKRSPGPVSPGLDVTVSIHWQQRLDKQSPLAGLAAPDELPSEQQQHLYLQTPLKLQLRHSREWYLFHETSSVLMLRQLRDGNLVSQCNISSTVIVPPGQHTPDSEFLADVRTSVLERKGAVQDGETVRDDGSWRIRHIRARGDATGKVIIWDYYLCTAATGEQFSIVFSHAQEDEKAFGEEAVKLLSTLQIARNRPALPFR
jgi:hypothetical protein